MAQLECLTSYFLTDKYLKDINRINENGFKGKVAMEWANLLHEMFSGKNNAIRPRNFHNIMCTVDERLL